MWSLLLACLLVGADPLAATPASVDLGDVRVGPPLVQRFQLTNHGTQALTITSVTSSCGCLAPKLDHQQLAPGASTTLTIEVNTLSQPAGPMNWNSRIEYRIGDRNLILPLDMRAKLIAEVRVEPASVAFHIRQARSVDLSIIDTRSKPFRITGVGTSLQQVKAELVTSNDAKTQRIRLTASPEGPSGVHAAVAWFTTDDPLYSQIKIPVTVTIPAKRRVVASPSTLDIDLGGSARIQLRDQEGKSVVVDRIETEGPLSAIQVGNSGQVVTLNAKCASKSAERDGTIFVYIREPMAERIAIPVIIR